VCSFKSYAEGSFASSARAFVFGSIFIIICTEQNPFINYLDFYSIATSIYCNSLALKTGVKLKIAISPDLKFVSCKKKYVHGSFADPECLSRIRMFFPPRSETKRTVKKISCLTFL
jgi:hypothetical protein